jgi:hypothetical protein
MQLINLTSKSESIKLVTIMLTASGLDNIFFIVINFCETKYNDGRPFNLPLLIPMTRLMSFLEPRCWNSPAFSNEASISDNLFSLIN